MEAATRPHSGAWEYHDDDCWCIEGRPYCNRDGWVWSCCGACKEDSDCTAPRMHPTYWNHPRFGETVLRYADGGRPVYKSNEEIRAIAPEAFELGLEEGSPGAGAP